MSNEEQPEEVLDGPSYNLFEKNANNDYGPPIDKEARLKRASKDRALRQAIESFNGQPAESDAIVARATLFESYLNG